MNESYINGAVSHRPVVRIEETDTGSRVYDMKNQLLYEYDKANNCTRNANGEIIKYGDIILHLVRTNSDLT